MKCGNGERTIDPVLAMKRRRTPASRRRTQNRFGGVFVPKLEYSLPLGLYARVLLVFLIIFPSCEVIFCFVYSPSLGSFTDQGRECQKPGENKGRCPPRQEENRCRKKLTMVCCSSTAAVVHGCSNLRHFGSFIMTKSGTGRLLSYWRLPANCANL